MDTTKRMGPACYSIRICKPHIPTFPYELWHYLTPITCCFCFGWKNNFAHHHQIAFWQTFIECNIKWTVHFAVDERDNNKIRMLRHHRTVRTNNVYWQHCNANKLPRRWFIVSTQQTISLSTILVTKKWHESKLMNIPSLVFGYICASHLRRTKSKAPLDIEYENRIHSTSKYHGGAALYNEYTSDVRELT